MRASDNHRLEEMLIKLGLLAMSRAGNTNNIKVFSKQTSSQGPVLNDDRIRIVACTENDHN